jgi:hypothetical protein
MGDFDEFLDVLGTEDELGMIIRAHIHIESRLNEIFDIVMMDSSYIDKMNLDFHDKVNLAIACGLHQRFAAPLNNIGTLRNNFAHRLGTKITKNEADSLYSCFTGDDKQVMQDAYKKTKKNLGFNGAASMSKLTPKEKLKLMLASLHHIIRAAANEIREHN